MLNFGRGHSISDFGYMFCVSVYVYNREIGGGTSDQGRIRTVT